MKDSYTYSHRKLPSLSQPTGAGEYSTKFPRLPSDVNVGTLLNNTIEPKAKKIGVTVLSQQISPDSSTIGAPQNLLCLLLLLCKVIPANGRAFSTWQDTAEQRRRYACGILEISVKNI